MSDSEDNPARDGRIGATDREGIRKVLRQLLHYDPTLLQLNPTEPRLTGKYAKAIQDGRGQLVVNSALQDGVPGLSAQGRCV